MTLPLFADPPKSRVARARRARPAGGVAGRRRPNVAQSLRVSATEFMRTALEFFNRPLQPARHEIAAVLAVAAWEKLLKAYLHKRTPTKIFSGPDRTISFEECRTKARHYVQLAGGHAFEDVYEHLGTIENYRNQCVHFVGEHMDTILHGLFAECVLKFADFLKAHFDKDLLPASHVGVLPVGYSFPLTAADFITKHSAAAAASGEVREFLRAMHLAGERLEKLGVAPEHSILVSYRLGLVSQKNAARADDTVRVDNTQPDAATLTVRRELDEKAWKAHFCLRHRDLVDFAKANGIKCNQAFQLFLKSLRANTDVFAEHKFDPANPRSGSTPCYAKKAQELLLTWHKAREVITPAAVLATET